MTPSHDSKKNIDKIKLQLKGISLTQAYGFIEELSDEGIARPLEDPEGVRGQLVSILLHKADGCVLDGAREVAHHKVGAVLLLGVAGARPTAPPSVLRLRE